MTTQKDRPSFLTRRQVTRAGLAALGLASTSFPASALGRDARVGPLQLDVSMDINEREEHFTAKIIVRNRSRITFPGEFEVESRAFLQFDERLVELKQKELYLSLSRHIRAPQPRFGPLPQPVLLRPWRKIPVQKLRLFWPDELPPDRPTVELVVTSRLESKPFAIFDREDEPTEVIVVTLRGDVRIPRQLREPV